MMEGSRNPQGSASIHSLFSGEALARVTAEKNNPQIDVLFGVRSKPSPRPEPGHFRALCSAARRNAGPIQGQGRRLDGDRRRSAGGHDQHDSF